MRPAKRPCAVAAASTARQAPRAGVGVTIPVVQSVEHAAGATLHKTRGAMATVRIATCRGTEVNPPTRHPCRS
jgi:hypothetical protein